MRLPALMHLLQVVEALTQAEAVTVLGSAALLAEFPRLGEPGGPIALTRDADLLVNPCDEQLAGLVHEAVGEGSLFDQRHGYHADLLRPGIAGTLPNSWQSRTRLLASKSRALSAQDVAAVKLRVGREKDLAVVAVLLRSGAVPRDAVLASLAEISMGEKEMHAALRRLGDLHAP